jgi:hypothetical protein
VIRKIVMGNNEEVKKYRELEGLMCLTEADMTSFELIRSHEVYRTTIVCGRVVALQGPYLCAKCQCCCSFDINVLAEEQMDDPTCPYCGHVGPICKTTI